MLPLFSEEASSGIAAEILREDTEVVAWWGTWLECSVAISRLGRENSLDETSQEESRAVLDSLAAGWIEIEPANDLRLLASLVAKDHPLKAADALQLAAALRWCEGATSDASFVCLDSRLRRAAADEGFDLLPEDNS